LVGVEKKCRVENWYASVSLKKIERKCDFLSIGSCKKIALAKECMENLVACGLLMKYDIDIQDVIFF